MCVLAFHHRECDVKLFFPPPPSIQSSKQELPVLDIHSERYGPTGNVAAAGIQNQLGRPKLDRLTVLVREALQNSWDARVPDGCGMRMRIELDELDEDRIRALRDHILRNNPPRPARQLDGMLNELSELDEDGEAQSTPLRLLMFSDRRTTGLGGPTRADVVSGGGEEPSRDFVDFLRNVGQPPDRKFSGGTYGYGKAILYNTSAIHTILVYTRCLNREKPESRFIAARLGEQFTVRHPPEQAGIYTGRHWWGAASEGEFVEPVVGEQADLLAGCLGMDRGFEPGERGTTIAIVAPVLDGREPEHALNYMGEQVLWNFWPLLRKPDEHSSERMGLTLWCDGKELVLPEVESFEPIRLMVNALENLEAHSRGETLSHHGGKVQEVRCLRPEKTLGYLSLIKDLYKPPRWLTSRDEDRKLMPIEKGHLSHVALMRAPRIVVRYERGERLDSDLVHYGGVFVVDEDLDQVYADSEPPTHDDWVPEHLEERTKQTLVRVGLRNVQRDMGKFIAPSRKASAQATHVELGDMSRALGGLLVGLPGTGAEVVPQKKKSRSGKKASTGVQIDLDLDQQTSKTTNKRSARIIVEDVELGVHDGKGVTIVTFKVNHATEEDTTPVRADLRVLLENGKTESIKERDNMLLEQPQVLFWKDVETGEILATGVDRLEVSGDDTHQAVVSMVSEARIKVRLLVDRKEVEA